MDKTTTRLSLLVLIALLLSACGGGGTDDHMVARGDFPIVFAARSAQALAEPTDVVRFAPGGDLILLDAASPRASRHNLTHSYTQGRGDVTDPEVSYDGRRIVFSMRGPDDETWNIWEYDLDSSNLRRLIADEALANEGDDLDPHYLPDGRIVFTSNRQAGFRASLEEAGVEDYRQLDRAARKPAYLLHVMDANGGGIEQISYNPSHDLNPTVLASGELLYSRWDVAGDRGEIPLYRARPDGSAMGVYYGAYSEGESFLHAREMEDGRLVATAVSLRQRAGGGALMVIDAPRYLDQNRPVGSSAAGAGGQHQPSVHQLPLGDGISPRGRFTTPYPLWDGTGRMLVAWSAYQPRDGGNPLVDPEYDAEAAPRYGIYMFDPSNGRQRPIALPDAGTVFVDPVAVMPRPQPPLLDSGSTFAHASTADSPYLALAAARGTGQPAGGEIPCEQLGDIKTGPRPDVPPGTDPCEGEGNPGGEGPGDGDSDGGGEDGGVQPLPEPPEPNRPMAVLNIKSVYDTDFTDLMGERVLLGGESIPQTADGRPDLRALRDGEYGSRPARFLRISEAVPLPPGLGLDMVSATSFKMKRIVGYAPVEPDGSVLVQVPANTPLALAVVDVDGRALQTYLDWVQLRPGEERICAGVDCRATDRRPPLNQGHPTGGAFENSSTAYSALPGETMAETRARVSEVGIQPANEHMVYVDVWTNGRWNRSVSYGGLATGATPSRGYINYPEHIQPIWDSTCASCHSGGSLDLTGGASNSLGRLASYDALVLGPVVPGAEMEGHDGRRVLQRERPWVEVGGAADSSRSSRLMQALYQLDIHNGLLNSSERRLIAEWIDLGAQYYNSPWDAGADEDERWELAELRNHALPDRAQFSSEIHPILMQECASCHRVHGRSGEPDDLGLYNGGHAPNRFMLSGDPEGNYHISSAFAFAGDTCNADASPLLQRARGTENTTPPHPTVTAEDGSRHPVLRPGDSAYTRLAEWVASGCR